MRSLDSFFKLFACCIPVRGYLRSVICDLQRECIFPIPNDLYDLLVEFENQPFSAVYSEFSDPENREVIEEYYDFLLTNDLGFWCENPTHFPAISHEWHYPGVISNAIIDIGDNSDHDYSDVFYQLDKLGCKYVQIRSFISLSIDDLRSILQTTDNSKIRSVEIIIRYHDSYTEDKMVDLLKLYPRLFKIGVHSAIFSKKISDSRCLGKTINFSTCCISNSSHCGQVDINSFVSNIMMFAESKNYNNCLNRKISIDENGQIKNCPSMPNSYGDIKQTKLSDVVSMPDFTKL